MAKALFTNNASGTLAAAITTTVATSLVLNGGQGALFPAPSGGNYFYATIIDASNNKEIVKVTANAADTFTMARAQDGTTARTFAIGSKVELRPCAAALTEKLPADAPVITGLVDISAASAGQIKFPATQNPSADANTLDDYEEGTFTLSDAYGVPGGSYTGMAYTKIGNRVFVTFQATFPVVASATMMRLAGMPFAVGADQIGFVTSYCDQGDLMCAYWAGGTALDIYYAKNGAAMSYINGGGKRGDFQGHYHI